MRELVTQLVEALEKCRDWPGAHDECSAAVTAAREYLATEPSGERAELIAGLRGSAVTLYEEDCGAIADEMMEAADMLEADDAFSPDWVNYRQGVKDGKADAQQAKPKTMGDVQDMCIAALQRDERAKVGDSRFESWYSELNQAGKGSKQIVREAYEAGLNEAEAQQAKRLPMTDDEIDEITSDNSLDSIHAVARAIEAHHGIHAPK